MNQHYEALLGKIPTNEMALRHQANKIVTKKRDKIISEKDNQKSDNGELSTGNGFLYNTRFLLLFTTVRLSIKAT